MLLAFECFFSLIHLSIPRRGFVNTQTGIGLAGQLICFASKLFLGLDKYSGLPLSIIDSLNGEARHSRRAAQWSGLEPWKPQPTTVPAHQRTYFLLFVISCADVLPRGLWLYDSTKEERNEEILSPTRGPYGDPCPAVDQEERFRENRKNQGYSHQSLLRTPPRDP